MFGKSVLDSIIVKNRRGPTHLEKVQHLFFEKGIGLEQFNSYPIPYILSMVYTTNHYADEEEKQRKKAEKKQK